MIIDDEDEAIHTIAEGPDDELITAWLLVAKYVGVDETTTIVQSCSDRMDMVTQLGLASAAHDFAKRRLRGEADDE